MSFTPLFGQKIMYGADYNPEQWLEHDEGFATILDKDLAMMQQAHCNIMSVGIFSWAKIETSEGVFDFSWLDEVLDRLNEKGVKVFLATPSGARPHWLAKKYPEVLRVNERRERQLFGARHNHCMTSPMYREKVRIMNTKLAERYSHHPAVIGWHLSNEYGGQCHCPLCQAKFREWLQRKYGTIENLNKQWWNTFWSHSYDDWSEIESPSPIGENAVHALTLDWMRFSSDNALDFCKFERDTVKAVNSDLPVTANFMEFFNDYDYFTWAKELDFISWDAYPQWHNFADPDYIASYTAMNHDLMRSLKGGQPFVLMESTPSMTNWRPLSTLKRPKMNILSSLQAVAHGADSVQYFQWRKSRGSSEKFHGAIVDHVGHLDTRVGREVIDLGHKLEQIAEVAGTRADAKVAVVFDTPNRWAINDSQGPRNKGMDYLPLCLDYYRAFFKRGISVDVIDETCDLSKYQLVIAPMTYMMRDGYADRVRKFVDAGGTYLSTYWSGVVNETDLCFLGGFPSGIKDVMGIWEEEIDSLDENQIVPVRLEPQGLERGFKSDSYYGTQLFGLVHPDDNTEVLLSYNDQFYQGMPVLTRHPYGKGLAYYVASRMDPNFVDSLAQMIVEELQLKNAFNEPAMPFREGVSAAARVNDKYRYVFLSNYSDRDQMVKLNSVYEDLLAENGEPREVSGIVYLKPYDARVFRHAL